MAKEILGNHLRMTFPSRMLLYIILDLAIINFVAYYIAGRVSLGFVLSVTAIEIIALTIALAFWVPKYKLKW